MSPSLRPALAAGLSATMGSGVGAVPGAAAVWIQAPALDAQAVVLGDLGVERPVVDADPGAGDVLAGEDLGDDGLGEVDGDGEADALCGAGLGGVDADDLAVAVEQRAAGVAGVDGGVGLDEVRAAGWRRRLVMSETTMVRSRPLTMPEVTDARELAQRVAHGDGQLADLERGRVAQLGGRQAGRVDLDEREVGVGVDAGDRAVEGPAVGEHDADLVGVLDDVMVGQDEAVGVDDDARAGALLHEALGPVAAPGSLLVVGIRW